MFIKNVNFHELFKLITLYVQRFYSDAHLQKCIEKYVNRVFLELISPNDIAYVLALIKNGKGCVGSGCEDGGNFSWRGREEIASANHKR